MLLATLISGCERCDRLPLLGILKRLTEWEDGVIIVATLLLFPTTLTLYGGAQVIFAAKEAVERRARKRGVQEGREEGLEEGLQAGRPAGRQEALREERELISAVLAKHGVSPDLELARSLVGESG